MHGSHPDEVVVVGDESGPDGAVRSAAVDALLVPRLAFPPRWRTVLLAASPTAVCRQGMSLYSATRAKPLLAQRALWALTGVVGPRAIPGTPVTWEPPMGRDMFARLWASWADVVGGPIDGFAVYQRAQAARGGVALLLCAGERSVFVRADTDPAPLELQRTVSTLAAESAPTSFRVPAVLGHGTEGEWTWLAFEPLSLRPHRPEHANPAQLARIAAEARVIAERAVARPADVPAHWTGAHGDLTPWNLRRAGSVTWLIDWEDVAWAPPGTDEVYYEVVRAALSRRPRPITVRPEHEEAKAYWTTVVVARATELVEGSLRAQMLVALGVAEGDAR